jgi:hypothetical protein
MTDETKTPPPTPPAAMTTIAPNGAGAGPIITIGGREGLIADVATRAMGLPPVRMAMFCIMVCAMMIVGTGCYVVWDSRGKLIDMVGDSTAKRVEQERTKSHGTALTEFVVRDKQYASLLNGTNKDLGASRTTIFSFHNGTSALNGMPFLFYSAMSEQVAPGVSREIDRWQRIQLDASNGQIQSFLRGECVRWDQSTAPTQTAEMMRGAGTVVVFSCPIQAEIGQEPSGFVSAGFQTGIPVPESAVVTARLKATASAVGSIQGAYLDALRKR